MAQCGTDSNAYVIMMNTIGMSVVVRVLKDAAFALEHTGRASIRFPLSRHPAVASEPILFIQGTGLEMVIDRFGLGLNADKLRDQFFSKYKNGSYYIEYIDVNCGNIGGQNWCFKYARGKWVLFVSNDVLLLSPCIQVMLDFAYNYKSAGQIMPTILKPDFSVDSTGLLWKWPGYAKNRTEMGTSRINIVPSITYLMKKAVWNYHNFREDLKSSHEDIDMGLRLCKRDYKLFVIGSAFAVHMGNQTLSKTIINPKQLFHRARLKIVRSHYKGFDRWLRLTVLDLYHCIFNRVIQS